jgi:hypothetical protein
MYRYYSESRRKGIPCIQYIPRKTNWICHILCRSCLLKHITEERQKGQEDEAEDVSIYWIILRKREDIGN